MCTVLTDLPTQFCIKLKYVIWYGNSLFDITEKYIVIAKYLIKYMIYVWRLHKEYTGCSLPWLSFIYDDACLK